MTRVGTMQDDRLTLAVPCRSDEPALGRTLAVALSRCREAGYGQDRSLEVVVCVNGPGTLTSRAVNDLRVFAARHAARCTLVDADRGQSWPPPADPLGVIGVLTAREGKPIAWNLLRAGARSALVVFLDADVDLGPDAIGMLLDALVRCPQAAIASPRTRCAPRNSPLERILAAPYRIDWPNLSGQLYAARLGALPQRMPEDVIIDERWLELTVGCERIVRVPEAQVIVRLPATLRDFLRQRMRIEAGKIQLAREYGALLGRGAPQPGVRKVLQSLDAADRLRALAYLVLRLAARIGAAARWRRGRSAGLWPQATSTKRWEGG